MNHDEFRKQLLREQYGTTTPEWRPNDLDRKQARDHIRYIEESDLYPQGEEAAS